MKAQIAEKAKLFVGLMYPDSKTYEKIISILTKRYGAIETESFEYDFTKFTKYYEDEIGRIVKKRFVVFKKLIDMNKIADVKVFTNLIEDKYSVAGKRKFNLDPGYFTAHKLVLPSMKDRAHKIYLGKGVYGDLTLLLNKNSCVAFGWTFPDYKSEMIQKFFINQGNLLRKP